MTETTFNYRPVTMARPEELEIGDIFALVGTGSSGDTTDNEFYKVVLKADRGEIIIQPLNSSNLAFVGDVQVKQPNELPIPPREVQGIVWSVQVRIYIGNGPAPDPTTV